MFRLMFAVALTAFIWFASSISATSHPGHGDDTEVYVVMFRADWCPPCKIVEPRLKTALRDVDDKTIEHVVVDISNNYTQEVSAHKVFDREIVKQYNQWFGATGFAAIIDADTKQTLGCVTQLYTADAMASHIRNLKGYALADAKSLDLTCPDAVRAL